MSYTMNGKPMWCRPAPTKTGSIWSPEDPDEEAVALSELPSLIERAIRAGLVQRPTAVDDPTGKLRMDRPSNVWSRCDTCHQQFQHGKKSQLTTCFPCRLPAATCKGCGKQFQPQRRSQLLCGKACVGLALTAAATERNKDRATVACVICGTQHLIRFAGGKMAVTCGRQCAQQHVAQISRDKKQQRQTK